MTFASALIIGVVIFILILCLPKGRDSRPVPVKPHEHQWRLEYRTGNANEGKSDVCSCACGTWAVRHYGKDYEILPPVKEEGKQ